MGYNGQARPVQDIRRSEPGSDGRHLAFQTEQILEENIGMIENVR
jgi:hypothetical protein